MMQLIQEIVSNQVMDKRDIGFFSVVSVVDHP
jgi:hypothetical protein